MPDTLTWSRVVIKIGQSETMPRLVRHGADRHDLRSVAGVRAANGGLQDVIADRDLLGPVPGPVVLGGVRQRKREPMCPEMVLWRALGPTFAPDRFVHEQHQRNCAARRIEI